MPNTNQHPNQRHPSLRHKIQGLEQASHSYSRGIKVVFLKSILKITSIYKITTFGKLWQNFHFFCKILNQVLKIIR
jgi:hypothetical protein